MRMVRCVIEGGRRALRVVAAAWLLSCATAVAGASADGLPTKPILKIETGNHTSTIRDIEVRDDGAVAATVSDDKTLRLWDAQTGELLETVRTPVGPAEEGVLNTAAYWPGGSHIITAGFTGGRYFAEPDGGRQNLLYFVRFAGGLETINRMTTGGIVNAIDVHRPDPNARATRLASAHARNPAGVRVIDERRKVLLEDELGAPATWTEFAPDGRLVAVAENGVVRLYDTALERSLTWRAERGRPVQARFSPDGRWLAVGYVNQARVDLLDTRDMRRDRSLAGDAPRASERFLSAVAWRTGASGQELWASGGLIGADRRILVRRWRDVDRVEAFEDIPVGRDAVTRLETTPDGDLLFATGAPAWGRIDAESGEVAFRVESPKADFRRVYESVFRTSETGAVVDFRFQTAEATATLRFDAANLQLSQAPDTVSGFSRPDPPAALDGWRDGRDLRLGQRLLTLSNRRDIARSATELPDGSVVVGSDYALTLFGPDGAPTKETFVLSSPSGVVASGDGTRLLAAHRDGTIRWYSLLPGRELQELAALFVHSDRQRWILWSPDGHFAHSTGGGQELAGYVRNRGRTRVAEWIDFSQLYSRFYDYDLMRYRVGRVAPRNETPADPAPSVDDAIARAPTVDLERYCTVDADGRDGTCYDANQTRRGLSRASADDAPAAVATLPKGGDAVRLYFSVTPGSEPVERYAVFLNGKTSGQTRGLSRTTNGAADAGRPEARLVDRTIQVTPGRNTLQARAYAVSGVFGKSETLTLEVPEPAEPPKPRLFVIAVGIDVYKSDIQDLAYARRDAVSIMERLSRTPAEAYAAVETVGRFDQEATADNVRAAFAEVAERIQPIDTLVVYFAGHGVLTGGGAYHFVTHDVDGHAKIDAHALDQAAMIDLLSQMRGANTLLMLDTCHSGAFPADAPGEIGNDTGYYVLAASSSEEEALDGYNDRNGVFAHAVLSTLDRDRSAAGTVTVLPFGSRVQQTVGELAREKGFRQRAQFRSGGSTLRDFPLARAN